MIEKLDRIFKKKNFARISVLFILFVIGLYLIISDNSDDSTMSVTNYEYMDYEHALEIRLKEFLETAEGINKVSVFITTQNSEKTGKDYFSDDNITDGRDNIIGVLIACTDGDRPIVRQKVAELVSTGLGIDTNKIRITAIDKS